MQYKFKNRALAKIPKMLIITAINPPVCYLIIKIDYANSFLVSKLIFLIIKFEDFEETDFTNNSQQNLKDKQDLINAFKDKPKT